MHLSTPAVGLRIQAISRLLSPFSCSDRCLLFAGYVPARPPGAAAQNLDNSGSRACKIYLSNIQPVADDAVCGLGIFLRPLQVVGIVVPFLDADWVGRVIVELGVVRSRCGVKKGGQKKAPVIILRRRTRKRRPADSPETLNVHVDVPTLLLTRHSYVPFWPGSSLNFSSGVSLRSGMGMAMAILMRPPLRNQRMSVRRGGFARKTAHLSVTVCWFLERTSAKTGSRIGGSVEGKETHRSSLVSVASETLVCALGLSGEVFRSLLIQRANKPIKWQQLIYLGLQTWRRQIASKQGRKGSRVTN